MPYQLAIVDYGMGNLNSVKRVLDRMHVDSVISSCPTDIINSEKIILPGVGHFGKAMFNLRELNLLNALHEAVMIEKKPILGICIGMQLMAKKSEEGNVEGLGWVDAEVVRFRVADKLKYKVPHMGWNRVSIKKRSFLMENITELSEFYFVHSYHFKVNDESDTLNETEYGEVFPSAIERGNIFGVQYHPEKSHDAGIELLSNFIKL
jgi:glutamine amidotransferase